MSFDKVLFFQCTTGVFGLLSFFFLAKIAYWKKIAEIQRDISVKILHIHEANALVKITLEGYKINSETLKDLVDSLKILNDRVCAYNARLNEATIQQRSTH